ncbi:hypothetical protein [Streptomyces sp. NPDC127072]
MTTFVGLVEAEGSPDLLDSLVWALWDLLLEHHTHAGLSDDQRLSVRR